MSRDKRKIYDLKIENCKLKILLLRSNKSDPCIPRCKRWTLAIGSVDPISGEANALSVPPGKYGRKAKTQRNRRGLTQAVDHVA